MNELITVLRRVILDDPVNFWDIYTSRSKISSQQYLMLALLILRLAFEFVIDFASFLLVNFTMKFEERALL